MPSIKVFSAKDEYLAAAVMSKALGQASQPTEQPRKRSRAEKTRPQNPNRLTLDQHVFPKESILRFTGEDGRVSARLLSRRGKNIRVKAENPIFCADRAWDQRAESGWMKQIEDEFQTVVSPIIRGEAPTVSLDDRRAVDRMYALWYWRSRFRELESQEVSLNGIAGSQLTLEQEENLESNGYLFARESGVMPARQLNGVLLQIRTDQYALHLSTDVPRWAVILARAGEFIVPDVPWHGIIPLTPRMALVRSSPDGMITEQNLAQINSAMRETSQDYFFARDFTSCPFL